MLKPSEGFSGRLKMYSQALILPGKEVRNPCKGLPESQKHPEFCGGVDVATSPPRNSFVQLILSYWSPIGSKNPAHYLRNEVWECIVQF